MRHSCESQSREFELRVRSPCTLHARIGRRGRVVADFELTAGFCAWLAGVLAEDHDAVVDDQDDVGPAVAVHVADGHVARFDDIADVAKRLALEDLEGDRRDQLRVAGVGGDLE